MDDLLRSQIKDSCKLAVPEGLHDLMSDISREVLRAQPKNLLQFITDYLAALLVSRENLNAGARICSDGCMDICTMGLVEELRRRNIDEQDIEIVMKLVNEYFKHPEEGKSVKECNLISDIYQSTNISVDKVYHIQEAIRRAFVRHQANNASVHQLTSDSNMDDVARAAQHTVELFRKTKPTEEEFHAAATKIQAAYRAYGVRRDKSTEIKKVEWKYAEEVLERADLKGTNEIDNAADNSDKSHHIVFIDGDYPNDSENVDTENRFADNQSVATNISEKTEDIFFCPPKLMTASSFSLAGSHVNLPKKKPYNVQDSITESEESVSDESAEKQKEEHFNVDYTKEHSIVVNRTAPFQIVKDYESDDFLSDTPDDE